MTETEVEANIISLTARVQRLEDGESEGCAKLEEMMYALAEACGVVMGFGPFAVKKEFAEEIARKGVGRIGFAQEVQGGE
jgi:hypothetical protein